jgi:PAS domain S-box-containing protein
MTKPDIPSSPSDTLRRRAEKALRAAEKKNGVEEPSPEKTRLLLHELRVHQIELEMQNEELRTTQEKLEASRDQYFDLYYLAPVGYLTLNKEGVIQQANLTAATLLGVARGSLIRQPLTRFILPEDQDLYYLHRKQLFETDTPQSAEIRLTCADRPLFWALLQTVPAKYGECRITLSDITSRKLAEESLAKAHAVLERRVEERTRALQKIHSQLLHAEKLSAAGSLVASIAHEINNPLQGVMNVLHGIQKRATLTENDAKLVKMAVAECHRMRDLIKNLQDFNRPTSGRPAPMDIHAALDSILLLSKNSLRDRKVTVKKKYAPNLPKIMAVADQIKQVFLNLLNNGADACENGGTITISTETRPENIVVRFQDGGKGIRPEDMDRIFEPFFSTKPAVKGTGLGLSVSYGIVKAHGGEITAQSETGKGSVFSVILPLTGEKGDSERDSAGDARQRRKGGR